MAKGMSARLIMFLVIFLLFIDFMIAPAMTFIVLQYPDFFAMNPVYVFTYVLILEIVLNAVIVLLVWFATKRK